MKLAMYLKKSHKERGTVKGKYDLGQYLEQNCLIQSRNAFIFLMELKIDSRHDVWVLAKCEAKMAGYWPSTFFACLWTETETRSINTQKRTRPISSHLDRTSLVNKGFIIWLSGKFFLRDKAGSPERARWLHLARSGSQSQRRI